MTVADSLLVLSVSFRTHVLEIEIDAFNGTPENNEVRDMLMSAMANNKEARRRLFHAREYKRFQEVRRGATKTDWKLIHLWVDHQAEHGQIEISIRSGGGFQLTMLPKGGFLADNANLCDAFATAFNDPNDPNADIYWKY